jgi:acyl-CoA thioesterase-1
MRVLNAIVIATALVAASASGAIAASVQIVALGASNTAGKGVGEAAAWPAQLQAILRAKGHDATVRNEGISGDDTSRMVARLGSAVPDGTKLVILDKAADNDRKRGINTDANVSTISARLKARHIQLFVIPGMHGWANHQLQGDGIHITAEGHRAVAQKLAGRVIGMIGKK